MVNKNVSTLTSLDVIYMIQIMENAMFVKKRLHFQLIKKFVYSNVRRDSGGQVRRSNAHQREYSIVQRLTLII